MEHQRLLSLKQVEESAEENSEKEKAMSEDEQEKLRKHRADYVQSNSIVTKHLYLKEFRRISD